jgi:tetratricopeptide (TPR) repeat protein
MPDSGLVKKPQRRFTWLLGVASLCALVVVLAAVYLLATPAPAPAGGSVGQQEAALRAAILASPQDPRPRVALIGFLLAAQRSYDALDAAREARAAFPKNVLVQAALADALAVTARIPEAIAVARPLAKIAPEHQIRLAGYLVRNGDREEAVRVLRPLPRLTPELALVAGQVYLDALRPADALPLLRAAAQARPQSVDVQTHLGFALMQVGEYQSARPLITRAVGQAPGVAALHFYLGSTIRLSGDLQALPEAEAHLRRATELAAGDGMLHYELALSRVQLRDWQNARVSLERAAELEPQKAEIQRDLGRIYERSGEPVLSAIARSRYLRIIQEASQAVRVLEPLFKKNPENLRLALALAEAYYDAVQTPRTLALLHRLREKEPRNPEVLEALFRGERAADHNDKALEALEVLLEVTPDQSRLLVERAQLLVQLHRYSEVDAMLIRLRDLEPNNPVRHYQLGLALWRWSQRPDRLALAEASFRQDLALRPKHTEAHYYLGLILQKAGRTQEAIVHLRRALELSPSLADALRALGRAYAIVGDQVRAQDAFRTYRQVQARAEEQKRLELPGTLYRSTPETRTRLYRFYLRYGKHTLAIGELEALLQMDPRNKAARSDLVALYGHSRRFQRQFEERRRLKE